MNIMHVYKIRDKKTGLYSTGGYEPRFTKNGKIWKRHGDLMNHFNIMAEYNQWIDYSVVYKDCELVSYEIIEKEVCSTSVSDAIAEIKQKKQTKKQQWEDKCKQESELREKKEYERLRKKFG